MNLTKALNIEDLRVIAERRLPRIAYDFLMALIGCTAIASLTPEYLLLPAQRSFNPVEAKRLVS